MTDDTKTAAPLTAHEVLDYLRKNPSFLQKHPEGLDYLIPPTATGGKGVADFQTYMIQRLKADKQEITDATRSVVENARANMNNQQRIHRAVLRLLECLSFEDFIHSITMDLAVLLDVDIAALIVEADGENIPHIHTSGIRVIPKGTIQKWMAGKNVMLQDDIIGIEAIYGGGANLVQSQILLRVDISMETPPAILAFGSRDPSMFREGQATDQILFLTRVIERCFRSWLQLPV